MDRRTPCIVALGCGLLVAFLGLQGCGVGIDGQGRAIIGVAAGVHPDADALTAGAGLIGTWLGGPVGGAGAVSLVGVIAGALGWRKTTADLKRERDDRLAAERAKADLEGAERGWNEREQAAVVQLPLGTPLPGAAPGPVPGNPA